MKYKILFIVLAISNYTYQLMAEGDYITAIERTYFQGIALLLAWGFIR